MLQQYFRAKESHPGVLVAMRVGDFYEFYGEDAEVAASALEITLTGREDGKNGRIAMAGVPFHAIEKYLARLVQSGHRVALCDQVEDPKKAKGLVRREVTRVLTAGTLVEDSMLQSGSNNFLAALCSKDGKLGLATLDLSTGEFFATEIEGDAAADKILQEIARLMPAELLVTQDEIELSETAKSGLGLVTTEHRKFDLHRASGLLQKTLKVSNLGGFGLDGKEGAMVAASMVVDYAQNNGLGLEHVESLTTYSTDEFMRLDPSTRRSLELTQNLADGSRRNTLLSVVDETVTAMGARLLRRWLEQPLLDEESIRLRQGAVARLVENSLVRGDLREALKKISDIERLVSRCATGLASPRDLAAIKASLLNLPDVDDALRKVALEHLHGIRQKLDLHERLAQTLQEAITDSPPLHARDGGAIQTGFDSELDKLRDLAKNGKSYIAQLETKEREASGIDKLKVGYNSVFGYYLEVSRVYADKVPEHYIRKQTLANAERYITAELKEHESAVLGAEEKAVELESEIFARLRDQVTSQGASLIQTARAVAELDALAGLAETAVRRRYIKPEIIDEDLIEIQSGRHPVVDATVGSFVPNDTSLDDDSRLMIITGPNMSGKSTYLRQVALIVLLAQIGSFVPAESCRVGLCDRIFTRIGAKDEIALGQSTFMVEMVESANILNNCTSRSLLILDEIGRGTSTYDGLAIAWAMVEYLAKVKAKTLFATHYHQLNAIADQIQGIANYRVSVEETGDQVIWTHRVLPGGTDKSYGLHVAKMAGVPNPVVKRAAEVLNRLESKEEAVTVPPSLQSIQMTLFEAETHEVVKELEGLAVEELTPMQALLKLDEWKRSLSVKK